MKIVGPEGLLAIIWITSIVQIVVVGLRIFANTRINRKSLSISDYWLIICLLMATVGVCGNTYIVARNMQMEKNPSIVTRDFLVNLLRTAHFVGYFYYLVMYAVKASFFAYYFHFVKRVHWSLKVVLWICIGATAASFVATILMNIFTCWPIQNNWTPEKYCTPIKDRAVFIIMFGLSTLTDLFIMLYPLALLRQLKLPRKTIYAALFVIMIGGLSILAGIIRFIGVWPSSGPNLSLNASPDAIRAVMFWSHLEFLMAFVAACLPYFRVLLRRRESSSKNSSYAQRKPGTLETIGSKGVRRQDGYSVNAYSMNALTRDDFTRTESIEFQERANRTESQTSIV